MAKLASARRLRKLRQIWAKQGGRCFYCARPMRLARGPKNGACEGNFATIDHYVPRSQGGCNDASNCVAACHECNSGRGDAPAPAFMLAQAVVRCLLWEAPHG